MKGTEKIIEQINADGAKKADAILEAASERCAEIRLKYDKKARELYTEKIREGVSAGQQKLEKLQQETKAANTAALEAERQALVEQCFMAAREKCPELSDGDFEARREKLRAELSERITKILFD